VSTDLASRELAALLDEATLHGCTVAFGAGSTDRFRAQGWELLPGLGRTTGVVLVIDQYRSTAGQAQALRDAIEAVRELEP
jgi:hypothetical protein